jgi:hypothetical protein
MTKTIAAVVVKDGRGKLTGEMYHFCSKECREYFIRWSRISGNKVRRMHVPSHLIEHEVCGECSTPFHSGE